MLLHKNKLVLPSRGACGRGGGKGSVLETDWLYKLDRKLSRQREIFFFFELTTDFKGKNIITLASCLAINNYLSLHVGNIIFDCCYNFQRFTGNHHGDI